MCKPFSCIVTKGKKVLVCENPNKHSHEEIVKEHNLNDTVLINRDWVRIEVYPYYNDCTSEVDTWEFQVDEKDTLPEWFKLDKEVYEDKCRKAAQKWKDNCVDKLGQHCIECTNGNRHWYKSGLRHRLDGPAVEYANGDKYWYKDGERHRENGPAIEYTDGGKIWLINDKPHRLDGPAKEYDDGSAEYWIDGLRHREDGPAIEYTNGDKEYWLDGKKVKESGVMG